jgi:hypothetical protein
MFFFFVALTDVYLSPHQSFILDLNSLILDMICLSVNETVGQCYTLGYQLIVPTTDYPIPFLSDYIDVLLTTKVCKHFATCHSICVYMSMILLPTYIQCRIYWQVYHSLLHNHYISNKVYFPVSFPAS